MVNIGFFCHSNFTILLVGLALICPLSQADVLKFQDEAVATQQLILRFCYEDKQLLPYYAGNGAIIPADAPGATIEHLQKVANNVGITLELVRQPWLRCLQQLENNEADALVAAYEADRAHFTVFPQGTNNEADSRYAINQLGLCLAYRFDNPLPEKIRAREQEITLARPLGYRPIPFPANTVLVPAHSPAHALDLVIEGRVDTTTVLCQLNGIDARERHLTMTPLQILYPPLHVSYGYLMVSQQFYRHHRQITEQLWQELPKMLDKSRYIQYLKYPDL